MLTIKYFLVWFSADSWAALTCLLYCIFFSLVFIAFSFISNVLFLFLCSMHSLSIRCAFDAVGKLGWAVEDERFTWFLFVAWIQTSDKWIPENKIGLYSHKYRATKKIIGNYERFWSKWNIYSDVKWHWETKHA